MNDEEYPVISNKGFAAVLLGGALLCTAVAVACIKFEDKIYSRTKRKTNQKK